MWCVELNPGDSVKVGDVTFTLKEKTGRRARIVVDNPTEASAILMTRTIAEPLDNSDSLPLAQVE